MGRENGFLKKMAPRGVKAGIEPTPLEWRASAFNTALTRLDDFSVFSIFQSIKL